jgi:uncharacterized phage protein (TIGR01671 family)
MNREIKFRAWNQDNQEFQYFIFSTGGHWSHNIEAYSTNAIKEWQQYTGLKDKNGKEIYEGDRVTYTNPHSKTSFSHEVRWDEPWAAFGLFEKNSKWCKESDWAKIVDVEVIGNIYENPELLNQK